MNYEAIIPETCLMTEDELQAMGQEQRNQLGRSIHKEIQASDNFRRLYKRCGVWDPAHSRYKGRRSRRLNYWIHQQHRWSDRTMRIMERNTEIPEFLR